jgi:hypothetical protein
MTLASVAFSTLSTRTWSKDPSEDVGVALVSETLSFGGFGFGSLTGTLIELSLAVGFAL